VRHSYDDPQHACSRCRADVPPEMDGCMPFRNLDGTWHNGCVLDVVSQESWDAMSWSVDYENGVTPVSLGRASWLPWPFVEAMREVRAAISNERRKHAERAQAKRVRPRRG